MLGAKIEGLGSEISQEIERDVVVIDNSTKAGESSSCLLITVSRTLSKNICNPIHHKTERDTIEIDK